MSALKDILARAERWPASAQQDLINIAMIMDRNQQSDFDLTEEDLSILDQRLESTRRGEIAPDADVEAMFAKFRKA